MVAVFVSYAREDVLLARSVVNRLQMVGYTVWFDQDLHGGEDWWARIVSYIYHCDVFVTVVSASSLGSAACSTERSYARGLGKRILPVSVDAVKPALPQDLAPLQLVDYSRNDADATAALFGALSVLQAAPPPSKPAVLPQPPPAPLGYQTGVRGRLEAAQLAGQPLSANEQRALLNDLERGIRSADAEEAAGAVQLVQLLRAQPDLAVDVDQRIQLALGGVVPMPGPTGPTPPGPTNPPHPSGQKARSCTVNALAILGALFLLLFLLLLL